MLRMIFSGLTPISLNPMQLNFALCAIKTKRGFIITELQNRVTHYDVTNRVIDSKISSFFIF